MHPRNLHLEVEKEEEEEKNVMTHSLNNIFFLEIASNVQEN